MSDPESKISKSLRRSQKSEGKQGPAVGPSVERGPSPPPFTHIPRVDTLGTLPETEEHDNDDLVALYDPGKGFVESYKEGATPKFFGESSAFAFSQVLGKDFSSIHIPPGRRAEFWTIPSVSPLRWIIGWLFSPA